MTTRKPYERLLAMALSIVMVLGMTPVTAMAQTTTDTIGEIIEFEALSEETANREVSLGTSLEDLNLPGALNATVRVATSTDAEKPDQDSGEPQFEEKDIPVPVTWASEPSYDGGTADTYTFTAEATGDGYTVSAALPTITVTVLEDSTPPPAKGGRNHRLCGAGERHCGASGFHRNPAFRAGSSQDPCGDGGRRRSAGFGYVGIHSGISPGRRG